MKLATLKNNTRDGQLVVVSRDLITAVVVDDIANTLQQAIEHWSDVSDKLEAIYFALNKGTIENTLVFNQKIVNLHYHVPINGLMLVLMLITLS